MATQKNSVHAVGNLNSSLVRTIPEIKAGENLENYSLVKLAHNANGERIATYLADATKKGVLAAAVEVMYDGEAVSEFYIGNGEYFRAVQPDKGVRFETSNYNQIAGTAPAVGQFASFDATAKKFKLEAVESATAAQTFEVVDVLNGEYGFGLPMVRLEVIK